MALRPDNDNGVMPNQALLQKEELQAQIANLKTERVQNTHVDSYRAPKLPDFFRQDPAFWFIHVESIFRNSRINVDNTKVDYIVPALGFEITSCFKDLLAATEKPPDYYEKVKERVISTYSSSPESRLRQLLKEEVLTDGKPSLVLSRLRNLNDGACSDAIIRSIFLEQLPPQSRAILAVTKTEDLQELAELADKIVEVSNPNNAYVATISTNIGSSMSTFQPDLDRLEAKIDRLASHTKHSSSGKTRSSYVPAHAQVHVQVHALVQVHVLFHGPFRGEIPNRIFVGCIESIEIERIGARNPVLGRATQIRKTNGSQRWGDERTGS